MRINILVGGKAGQGINKISSIVSDVLNKIGYYVFNYRDYQSLIKGGHNFNILSISNKKIGSVESKLDGIVALDEKTIALHKKELKKGGFIIGVKEYSNFGKNINIVQAGALIRILGIEKKYLIEEIEKNFEGDKESLSAVEKGYESVKEKFFLKKLGNKVSRMSGTLGIVKGALNSKINVYISYPMTPATGVLHELGLRQKDEKNNLLVFQAESEIAVVNAGLGASFAGARTMVGTSGGGFDLMTEAFSFQGMSEIPLVVYLASRPGPSTGMPTYSTQADLNVALFGGHGEFPRVVIAPGDPLECIEKTNEAFYLSAKFGILSIILSDKHLAESEFSTDRKPNKTIDFKVNRKFPGKGLVKASSYEHDEFGNTIDSVEIARKNIERRIKKEEDIKKECKKFEMIKTYGNPYAKNLVVGWGSTKTVILDALDSIDNSIENPKKGNWRFLQVLYTKPFSDEIKKEILKAKRVILVENNSTAQLGRLIQENNGIKIQKKILKYDGRPFLSDELKEELLKIK